MTNVWVFFTYQSCRTTLNLGHLAKEEMKGSDTSSVEVPRVQVQ